MHLDGRRALVTGASRGIGASLADALARAGVDVVLVGRDQAALTEVATRTGGVPIVADLTDARHVRRLVEHVERDHGPVDLLVNNAGVEHAGDFADLDAKTMEDQLRVNLWAPMELTRQVVPGMLDRRVGHVVNMSSLSAFSAFPGVAVYGASKAGLTQFTAGLRADLRGTPVGTTVVELGPTGTAMMQRLMGYPPTGDSFARLYRWRLLTEVAPQRVAAAVVAAVEADHRHVRLPRRAAVAAQLAGSPRRTTEMLLTGIKHQQAR